MGAEKMMGDVEVFMRLLTFFSVKKKEGHQLRVRMGNVIVFEEREKKSKQSCDRLGEGRD